eukprot:4376576-Amphidinium_carterae.1
MEHEAVGSWLAAGVVFTPVSEGAQRSRKKNSCYKGRREVANFREYLRVLLSRLSMAKCQQTVAP